MYNTLDNLVEFLDSTQNNLERINIWECGEDENKHLITIFPLENKFKKSLDMLSYTITMRSISEVNFQIDKSDVYLEEPKKKDELQEAKEILEGLPFTSEG